MLEIFHKYQKSVPVVVLALLICVSMLPFGTGMGSGGSRDAYAIKVNGEEISQGNFNLVRNNLENLYRQQFGDYYAQLVASANINITQQTIDRLIESELLRQFNKDQGLAPSERAIEQQIKNFFGGDYTKEQLAAFLKNTGQTPQQLRSRLELDLQSALTSEMLADFSKISDKEVFDLISKEKTAYNYHLAKFIPENFKDKIAEPSQEELEIYYDDRVADYEFPEKIKYDYLYFDPAKNLNLVEVDQDQIELYYSENQSKFIIPEKVKVSELILKEDVNATELAEKINSGASLEELAKENSTDPSLAKAHWKSRGEDSPEFEEIAFAGRIGAAEVVEAEENTRIIRIEDYQEEQIQELDKVEDEIKTSLQQQDVAAFLLIKIEDVLANASENGQKLVDIASEEGLTIESTELLDINTDPNPKAQGLTEKVMANNQQTLQLQEIKDDIYIVEVKDYQAARYPELKEIKTELITAWKKEQTAEFATTTAQNFLDKLQEIKKDKRTVEKFTKLAKKLGAEVVNETDVKLADAASKTELRAPDTQDSLSRATTGLLPEVFTNVSPIEKYVFYIDKITLPSEEAIQAATETKKSQYNQQSSRELYQALVDSLKAQAEIEIANNLSNL